MKPVEAQPDATVGSTHRVLDEKAKARLQKATKDFEALFLSYIIKSMRNGLPKDEDATEEGYGGELMEGLMDAELSRHVAKNSNLGLAEMLYRSVTGEDLPRATPRSSTTEIGNVKTGVPAEVPPHKESAAPQARVAAVSPAVNVVSRSTSTAQAAAASTHTVVPDSLNRRIGSFESLIQEASDKHSVDANLLKAVIAAESAGHANARSSQNAKGLMQLIDSTATEMGVQNVWDPRQNIEGGARYLAGLMTRFRGDLERAVASYNAGPGAVEKHGGIPPYKETHTYVDKVLNYLRYFEQQGADNEK
jgi:soluble lytic murein transglycosylase-like protein